MMRFYLYISLSGHTRNYEMKTVIWSPVKNVYFLVILPLNPYNSGTYLIQDLFLIFYVSCFVADIDPPSNNNTNNNNTNINSSNGDNINGSNNITANNLSSKKQLCGGSKPAVERMLEFGRELFLLSLQLRQELGKSETNKKMLQVSDTLIFVV